MTEKEFDEIVENRLNSTKKTLITKGKEYRRNNDPLHNFNEGAKITGISREKVLSMFALKHLISFKDILSDLDKDPRRVSKELVSEKVGDMINYLILAEASIYDKIKDDSINKILEVGQTVYVNFRVDSETEGIIEKILETQYFVYILEQGITVVKNRKEIRLKPLNPYGTKS